MEYKNNDVDSFAYYKDYTIEDLLKIRNLTVSDIEFLKLKNDDIQRDLEIERLKYLNELIKEKENERIIENNMKNGFEKRFDYLKSKTKEELIEVLKEEEETLKFMKDSLNDKTVSTIQKSEYINSDIHYEEDIIRFINKELDSRSLK